MTDGIRRICATGQSPSPSEHPFQRPPQQVIDQWRITLNDRLASGSGLADVSVAKVKSHGIPTQWPVGCWQVPRVVQCPVPAVALVPRDSRGWCGV